MAAELIKVIIMNREQILFQGEVKSLTSVNITGEFDILARHQNFISVIKEKVVLRPAEGQPIQYPITQGIMHVVSNSVRVFLGIGKSLSSLSTPN